VLDAEAKTTFVNGRMAAILGRRADELTGTPSVALIHPDSRAVWAQHHERRQTGISHDGHSTLRADGKDLWVLVDSTPSFDESGRYEGMLAMAVDMTDRRRLEGQLRQARRWTPSAASRAASRMTSTTPLGHPQLHEPRLEGLTPGDPIHADLEEVRKAGSVRPI